MPRRRRDVLENPPSAVGPAALAPRERQLASLAAASYTNKLIAYELGVSDSTVRVQLARAMKKLAVVSRSELIAVCRAYRTSRAQ